MTLDQILSLALQMLRTLRNGLARAAHYLASVGVGFELARQTLLGVA